MASAFFATNLSIFRLQKTNKLELLKGADGTKGYYTYNGHGDVTTITDASGAPLNEYTYDIWGLPLSQTQQIDQPFLYSGEYWDDTVHLQYLRARWYDPGMGRFINEDTYEGELGNPLSLNLYTYVENNPLIYIDPSGHAKTTNYLEIEWMINKAMGYRADSQAYWDYRSNLGQIFKKVYKDDNNNQFKYLYGLLTQTSSYSNSQGAAEWAKSQLLGALDKGQAKVDKTVGWVSTGLDLMVGLGAAKAAISLVKTSTTIKIGDSLGELGKVVAHPNQSITSISKHALERAAQRGVSESLMHSTVSNAKLILDQNGTNTYLYLTAEAVVVLNRSGKVVTTYGKQFFDDTIKAIVGRLK